MNSKNLRNKICKTIKKQLLESIHLVRGADINWCPADQGTIVMWAPSARTRPSYLLLPYRLGFFLCHTVALTNCLCQTSFYSAFPTVSSACSVQLSLCTFEKGEAVATKFKYRKAICFI